MCVRARTHVCVCVCACVSVCACVFALVFLIWHHAYVAASTLRRGVAVGGSREVLGVVVGFWWDWMVPLPTRLSTTTIP